MSQTVAAWISSHRHIEGGGGLRFQGNSVATLQTLCLSSMRRHVIVWGFPILMELRSHLHASPNISIEAIS